MKVLHIAETLTGGISSYLDETLGYQRSKLGADNIHTLLPDAQSQGAVNTDTATTHHYRALTPRFFRVFTLAWAFIKLYLRLRPDVIHLHSSIAGGVVRLCMLLLPGAPKVVYCAHGWAWDRDGSKISKRLVVAAERILAKITDSIICISTHDHNTAIAHGIPPSRLRLVFNGIANIPATEATYIDIPARDVLFVGRFDQQKGADLFIQALAELAPNVSAYMIGDAVLGVDGLPQPTNNVKLTGWIPREQVGAYMARVQVVVIPSRWEGFGLVALEAMRCNRAVIAANVGGLKDLVIDNVTGLLVKPNSSTALADAIKTAMKSDLAGMGQRGRCHFEQNFTADKMNTALLACYMEHSHA
jgi:glycosyltransferase involved in cell wall biosynthesis